MDENAASVADEIFLAVREYRRRQLSLLRRRQILTALPVLAYFSLNMLAAVWLLPGGSHSALRLLVFVLLCVGLVAVLRNKCRSVFSVLKRWPSSSLQALKAAEQRLAEAACAAERCEGIRLPGPTLEHLHDLLDVADPEGARTIMWLLESVGDRKSLWYLESIAGKTEDAHLMRQARKPGMRAAASRSAEKMVVRLTREQQAEVLLRAAQPCEHGTLLRPSAPATTPSEENLLRATELET